MTKIVKEEKAKQGRSGTRVLTILVVALVLACGAWAISEFYGEAIDAQPTQTPAATPAETPPGTGNQANPQ